MNTSATSGEDEGATGADGAARPAHPLPSIALTVLIFLEAAGMAALSFWLIIEAVTTTPASYAAAIAIIVLALIATVWLVFAAIAALRGRAWVRGGAITWQVLQGAVGIGFFQGDAAAPGIGWALLAPALIGIALALWPRGARAEAAER